MSEDEYLFFETPELHKKYDKLHWSGVFFIVIGIGFMVATFFYYRHLGAYEVEGRRISQIIPFLLMIIPAYGFALTRQAFKGRKSYYRAAMNGMLIDAVGIKGPLALLEGPLRDYMRDKLKQDSFRIKWENIEKFIVEPYRGKRKQAPPYYKVTLKGMGGTMRTSFFILRKYFHGREDLVLSSVKKYLDDEQIVLNDELVTEEKTEEAEGECK